jgi:hypothetical protein
MTQVVFSFDDRCKAVTVRLLYELDFSATTASSGVYMQFLVESHFLEQTSESHLKQAGQSAYGIAKSQISRSRSLDLDVE